jgi:hypothetical protein
VNIEAMTKNVEGLLNKAAEATDAPAAQCFSQAACNAANAMRALSDAENNVAGKK